MKPEITVSTQDLELLESILDTLPASDDACRDALLEELSRAHVIDAKDVPPTVVSMNSKVRFEIESPKEEFCLTLCFPKSSEARQDALSVLTPIGTALLGMSEGSFIEWPRRDGQMIRVKVLEVYPQQADHKAA
ncbi:nucleoside diphosphate kinase regulator [Noviherbaspirillum malthae]|uniref:nucleoside diphosphate kinase regulator n=1 Tax=Noviherbaspirillum malthae TaxID=1260987 RepID=UPI00188DFD48|nr:nucleoside diphosphate kinase regulator [Noviherbaspirillum malthae]